jgi:hypothetical protein
MIEFHNTGLGRRFFEGQLPALIRALEAIGGQLMIQNEAQEPTTKVSTPSERHEVTDAMFTLAEHLRVKVEWHEVEGVYVAEDDEGFWTYGHPTAEGMLQYLRGRTDERGATYGATGDDRGAGSGSGAARAPVREGAGRGPRRDCQGEGRMR